MKSWKTITLSGLFFSLVGCGGPKTDQCTTESGLIVEVSRTNLPGIATYIDKNGEKQEITDVNRNSLIQNKLGGKSCLKLKTPIPQQN